MKRKSKTNNKTTTAAKSKRKRRMKPMPPKLVIEPADEILCDECGKPMGTLYKNEGRLVCKADLPFDLRYNSRGRLLSIAVSGMKAIKKFRSRQSNSMATA